MIISELFIAREKSIIEALKQLSNTAKGILFVVDDSKILEGTLTDGDIRRFILDGGDLSESLDKAANHSPKVATDIESARAIYDPRHYHAIPIIDDEGRIIDVFLGDSDEADGIKAALNIPVVINAGGKGTRLDPYTKVLPKPLIPVGDWPIIEHIFKEFGQFSCNDFHVIVNYKKEIMKAYFSEPEKNYNICWYDEDKPLGTGGGLSLLKGVLKETFFFTNCDILLKSNYESMINYHKENHNLVTMICAYKTVAIPYGVVDMGKNGLIEGLREKPEFTFLTNTGMYIVEPEVLDYIEDNTPVSFPDVVEKLRLEGKNVAVYPVSESEWYDMGQLPELEKMRKRLLR